MKAFKPVKLKDLKNTECDEIAVIDMIRLGTDDFVEIWDYAIDHSWVCASGVEIPTNEDYIVYVR